MNKSELAAQNKLKESKPLVYEKVIVHGMRMVRIEPSYICNMHCKHCCIKNLQKRIVNRHIMTIEDIENISRQADELGFAQVVISGGEPQMFPNFDEIVAAIEPQKFQVTTDSNGWFLDRERAFHLKEIGVDKIQLSIDNVDPKVHDEFRQKPGAFVRAIKAIEYCQEAGLNLIIQTVVDKQRVHDPELMEFIEYFNGLGCPIYLCYAKPVGAWSGKYDVMIDTDDFDYIASLEKDHDVFTHMTPQYDYPGGCIAMKRSVNIDRWGDVNPCLYMKNYIIGNAFTEPLKDIVARGMKQFSKHIPYCPAAMDRDFMKTYNSEL